MPGAGTVLVLGASRGIGLELVRQYRDEGRAVMGSARDDAGLARITALGATPLRLDVADPASACGLASQLRGQRIDLALYVAGVMGRAGAGEPPTQAEFDRVMHTNVLGAMQIIPQVAPLLAAADGRFVFVTSQMGRIGGSPGSDAWLYRVSKAALNMAVVAAQAQYPRTLMVCMHPGWVQTDMGGGQAPLTAVQSVRSMRRTVASLGPAQRGAFINHDGQPFPGW